MLPEDRIYYESMNQDRFPPDPWQVSLVRVIGVLTLWIAALVGICTLYGTSP